MKVETITLPVGTKLRDIWNALSNPNIKDVIIECNDAKTRERFHDSLVAAFHRKSKTVGQVDFRTQGNTQVLFTRKAD